MEKKRFIFDLDNTLLTFDSEYQDELFKNEFGEDNPFNENLNEYLATYWASYPKYVEDRLAGLLSLCSGLRVTEDFVARWIDALKEMPIVLEDGVVDTLNYLKKNGKNLAILTNLFWECQIPRLEKAGIYHFFDKIYTGDFMLKPHSTAYDLAIGSFSKEECLFIGDDLENDYIRPRELGYDAILYDKKEEHPKNLVKIKKIDELKRKY